MKKLLILICIWISGICSGQELVPNGGFEQYSSCPSYISQLYQANSWTLANQGSADYFNQCSDPNAWNAVSVPSNLFGYQPAHNGGGYVGISLNGFSQVYSYREYVQVPLLSPLNAKACYHFEMYINLGDLCKYTTHDLGVYFSNTLLTYTNTNLNLPLTPQISNMPNNRPDTLNWTLVGGTYTAVGGEKYLTIGNFKSDTNADTINVNQYPGYGFTYIYIDDVSLKPCSTVNITEQTEQPLALYPNPITDKLKIELKNNEPTEITLYDLSLKELFQQTFTNAATINIEQLSNGMYFYEVRNKNGIIKNGKVIKE
jgi:OOP family OmpA-OmpF porin